MSLYAWLMLLSLAGPLALSFDSKVAYYKWWPGLFAGILVNAILFISWDIWFVKKGVWSFNSAYTFNCNFLGLPAEEWAFFLVIPYASVFIYACIKSYFANLKPNKWLKNADLVLIVLLPLIILFNLKHTYTLVNASVALLVLCINRFYIKADYMQWFWPAYIIHLVPFFIINGILTAKPVVIYNSNEITGLRLGSIPAEDSIYALSCLLIPVMIIERFRSKQG